MENVVQGLPGVCVYIDDILVTGRSEEEHNKNLETRLQKYGVRLKKNKCTFLAPKL